MSVKRRRTCFVVTSSPVVMCKTKSKLLDVSHRLKASLVCTPADVLKPEAMFDSTLTSPLLTSYIQT